MVPLEGATGAPLQLRNVRGMLPEPAPVILPSPNVWMARQASSLGVTGSLHDDLKKRFQHSPPVNTCTSKAGWGASLANEPSPKPSASHQSQQFSTGAEGLAIHALDAGGPQRLPRYRLVSPSTTRSALHRQISDSLKAAVMPEVVDAIERSKGLELKIFSRQPLRSPPAVPRVSVELAWLAGVGPL